MSRQSAATAGLAGPPGLDGELCAQCASLGLVMDKFLPPEAAENKLPGFLDAGFDSTGLDRLDFGYLDVIYSRRLECPFCWLLFEATRFDGGGSGIGLDGLTSEGGRVPCSLDWQLDGRLMEGGKRSKPPTRRLRVFHPEQLFPDTYIVPLPAATAHAAAAVAAAAEPQQPTFLGRRIAETQVDLGLLRGWLDVCRKSHSPGCYHGTLTDQAVAAPLRRVRFIDLEAGRLVELSDREAASATAAAVPYATVSYMWGGVQFMKLHKQNYEELRQRLGPEVDGVPNTLRDAMVLTRQLGIRYLWIDSLCILQDCPEDWESMAPQMDRIYGNSALNICAALGSDPRDGLPGTTMTPRRAVQPVARYGGLDLTVVRPVESLIERSNWNGRAWTFQERMLSRRSLIFTHDRVFFQCRAATWSEEIDSESSQRAWTLEMVRSPVQNFSKNPVRLFLDCVELYSTRRLTYLADRLVAFKGMEAVLCPPLRAVSFYGLPDSYFDFALLWERSTLGQRLMVSETTSTTTPAAAIVFPSWSWCGWDAGCTWRMSMVSGTLLNLQEWLTEHTWVVWYRAWYDDDSFVHRMSEPPGSSSNSNSSASRVAAPPPPAAFKLVWAGSSLLAGTAGQERVSRWDGYRQNDANVSYGRRKTPCHGAVLLGASGSDEERPTIPTREPSPPNRGMLYFWTWTAHFQLSRKSMTTAAFASKLEPGLHRFGIADAKGDWCGTVVLDEAWFDQVGGVFEFAAISEAREFAMDELDTWNYYIPEERAVSEWYLFYAILLRWNEDGTVAERVGLAKIYQDAFRSASFPPGTSWKEITLG